MGAKEKSRNEGTRRQGWGRRGKVVLATIAQMKESNDRSMCKRLCEIVTITAPELMLKTWYGMPVYANVGGIVVCFFQAASKFGARDATFGFQPDAILDDGTMRATSFAVLRLPLAEEAQITAPVEKAVI